MDTSLLVVTAELVSWSDWLTDHPDTTVLDPDPRMKRRYKETAYERYFRSPDIKYPVDPLPGVEGLAIKDLVVVVDTNEERGVYPVAAIGDLADTTGIWETTLGATPLRFRYRAVPPTVVVWSPDASVHVRYAFWFAWHAMYPQDQLATPPPIDS